MEERVRQRGDRKRKRERWQFTTSKTWISSVGGFEIYLDIHDYQTVAQFAKSTSAPVQQPPTFPAGTESQSRQRGSFSKKRMIVKNPKGTGAGSKSANGEISGCQFYFYCSGQRASWLFSNLKKDGTFSASFSLFLSFLLYNWQMIFF